MFRLPKDEELDEKKLTEFLVKHTKEVVYRYRRLQDAYMTDYPIFCQEPKPKWKPDNRIAVNFAKYIVDTYEWFFHWYSDKDHK